jgi:hypothetical protein
MVVLDDGEMSDDREKLAQVLDLLAEIIEAETLGRPAEVLGLRARAILATMKPITIPR